MPFAALKSAAAIAYTDASSKGKITSSMVTLLLVDVFPKQFGKPNVIDGSKTDVTSLTTSTLSMQWKVSASEQEKWFWN